MSPVADQRGVSVHAGAVFPRGAAFKRCAAVVGLSLALLSVGCSGKLTIEVSGKGMVNVLGTENPQNCSQPLCELEVPGSAELVLKAAPLGNGVFQGWAGDCIGENPECKLTVDGEHNVKARFIKKFKATITIVGDGKVTSEDGRLECPGKACEAEYKQGEELRLRRLGGKDVFNAFSGDCTGKECSMIVKKDTAVTATFTVPAGHTIAGAKFGSGTLKSPMVTIAVDEKGGWAVVGLKGKKAHIGRYDATGKEIYTTTKKVGASAFPPAVGFYGDDVLIVVSTEKSSSVARVAPDGKTLRYNRLLSGCPALTHLEVKSDAIFVGGSFGGDGLTCGDRELLPSGSRDIVVLRLAVEDGGITWVSQFGSKVEDRLTALAVTPGEDTWVGYNAGEKGGRLVRLNPAGKSYPEINFGGSDETQVLDVNLGGPYIQVSGHVFAVVDFGGGHKLGVAAKDGAGRAVWVQMDDEGRHKASKLVARSRCGEGWLCAFDKLGGFVRLPNSDGDVDGTARTSRKKRKKKKSAGTIRLSVNRLGDDGAERWSGRLKGTGFAAVGDLLLAPDGSVFVAGVLEGELTMTGRVSRLKSQSPSFFWVRLKG